MLSQADNVIGLAVTMHEKEMNVHPLLTTQAMLAKECQYREPVQVWGRRGMVSSMHPAASAIGAEILRDGGNAMDAAVAVGAAISVLSSDWAGPAGDSAWLIYDGSRNWWAHLDGYSTCPEALSPKRLINHFGLSENDCAESWVEEPAGKRDTGIVTAMVPGTPAAWCELATRCGRLPLEALLEPAIALANDGFVVNGYLGRGIAAHRTKLAAYASSRAVWLTGDDEPIQEGAIIRQRDLASTLKRLASLGHKGFYEGPVADAIAHHSALSGGAMSSSDLANYRCRWREVVHGKYRDKGVVVSGPPTAGLHVLQALQLLEGFQLAEMGFHSQASLHVIIEALKLALADRRRASGDPDFSPANAAGLLDPAYISRMSARIDIDRAAAQGSLVSTTPSTTHFVVADAQGSFVSATQSIGGHFGCGETVDGTGLLMNDRTWWMSLGNGPNQVRGGRRAGIGHAPTILTEGKVPVVALGSPGGFGIVQYVVQVITHMVDYGLDIQRAIEAPRFRIESLGGRLGVERRLNADARRSLEEKGHEIVDYPEWSDLVGGVEGVQIDARSEVMLGGYDPRRNSMAVGL